MKDNDQMRKMRESDEKTMILRERKREKKNGLKNNENRKRQKNNF